MATIHLKKGLNLPLAGRLVDESVSMAASCSCYAVVPDDFQGIVPRMDKREGDAVHAGDVLYHDKTHDAIKVVSPVSGVLKEVRRGERRKIEAIVIESDGTGAAIEHNVKRDVRELLLESGLWVMLRQRPYDVVPSPEAEPSDIFVTAFDSAPLAPNLLQVVGEKRQYLAAGVKALQTLTAGKVYVGFKDGEEFDIEGAEINSFKGPHPAGNVGVQLANVKPVNKGEVVWTLDIVTLARIGELMTTGKVPFDTLVAVTGERVKQPHYVHAIMGCTVEALLKDNLCEGDNRIISGNALSGVKVPLDGFLRAPYRHLTVIPEVSCPDEFMGWAALSPKRFSIYRTFTSWLTGSKDIKMDARIKGGERAIVRLDEYDDMLPMDIYAEFLIKAIITRNIDKMEQLGIYEVAPEDFALAEYADTSKLELQRIVREGLDFLRGELS